MVVAAFPGNSFSSLARILASVDGGVSSVEQITGPLPGPVRLALQQI
jgi:hypothetical protein